MDDAEAALNEQLEEDTNITLDWISDLEQWAEASVQLRVGQTPPLPWDPAHRAGTRTALGRRSSKDTI